ncbi:hypothetical protein [Deinococcus yavapaiensis]|uniref:TubC N-terminal docking domain-containing protein n=1 Tax=Deinococcus yavapaiensis KR-236 TaxID=694435 RepID=A0A318S4J6_9DEIO|nr:hypothetical protein [Deinococcus yavapaiensis]PYE52990.1 hypothetical protein DES52_111163 [Deinococcus yavapaiensis KR-236]
MSADLVRLLRSLEVDGVRLGLAPDGRLRYRASVKLTPERLAELAEHKDVLTAAVRIGVGARLPGPLARLVGQAAQGSLQPGGLNTPGGLVTNVSEYVVHTAASHAVGNSDAERRLWNVWRALQR